MMMEPRAVIKSDGGSMMTGLHTFYSNLSSRRLILLHRRCPVHASVGFAFVSAPRSVKTSTNTWAPLFLGQLPYGEVKQGVKGLQCEGHSSNSKYVPPFMHHDLADSWIKHARIASWPQWTQACPGVTGLPDSSAGICFWVQPNDVNEQLWQGRDWTLHDINTTWRWGGIWRVTVRQHCLWLLKLFIVSH